MAAAGPRRVLAEQSEQRFVDERRGLQRVIVTLAAQKQRRESVQLGIHDPTGGLGGSRVARLGSARQLGERWLIRRGAHFGGARHVARHGVMG